jgi:hypothetical protein
MMNLKQKFLMGATIMLLATGNVWSAASAQGCASSGGIANGCTSAPEIDAASGAAAIALLTGVILLLRKGRKSKTDETKSEV